MTTVKYKISEGSVPIFSNAKGVEYVFARGDNMVYIYSKGQILGVMKMKHFENISVE